MTRWFDGRVTQLDLSVEFATNPEPRCACVLLLDVSGSMGGRPIAALNEGLRAFAADLAKDGLASQRVEVAIVTFSPSKVLVMTVSATKGFAAGAVPGTSSVDIVTVEPSAVDLKSE